ncbi:uncharacterized protein [Amphiura filiformis]|uniref:uncharacterized protein n=1 Tax=Amphiura filiformis TaxID=82378 RepID=UPI003B21F7F2
MMILLRTLCFLGFLWCASCQNMTTNSTDLPTTINTTEVTDLQTINATYLPTTYALMPTENATTTTLVTSLKPTTAGEATTAAGTTQNVTTAGISTNISEITQLSSTLTTDITTEEGVSPVALSTSVIAVISIVGALLFVVILAGLAVLYQRRKRQKKRQPRKKRNDRNDVGLSIHRAESVLIIDDNNHDNRMDTFNTSRNVDTIGYDNSVFLKDEEGKKGIPNGETGTVVEANGGTTTLPSKTSLVITNEMDTPVGITNQNGLANGADAKMETPISESDMKAVQNTIDEIIAEQKQMNGDVKSPDYVVLEPGDSDPKPDEPESQEDNNEDTLSTGFNEEETDSERPESGIPYDITDMDSVLEEGNEDMQS